MIIVFGTAMLSSCQQSSSVEDDVFYYAHRGFSADVPDDSIAGFELAAKKGYGIDCDLWPTAKDSFGEFDIAVSHDNHLIEVAEIDGYISEMTADEVARVQIVNGSNIEIYSDEYIPLVSQVFSIAQEHDCHLLVEMKGEWTSEQCRKLLDKLIEYNLLDCVIVNSLHIDNLRTFLSCVELYSNDAPDTLYTVLDYETLDERLEAARKANVNMVSMRSSEIGEHSEEILKAVSTREIELLAWTAGEENESAAAKAMIELGIRYIAVDSDVM